MFILRQKEFIGKVRLGVGEDGSKLINKINARGGRSSAGSIGGLRDYAKNKRAASGTARTIKQIQAEDKPLLDQVTKLRTDSANALQAGNKEEWLKLNNQANALQDKRSDALELVKGGQAEIASYNQAAERAAQANRSQGNYYNYNDLDKTYIKRAQANAQPAAVQAQTPAPAQTQAAPVNTQSRLNRTAPKKKGGNNQNNQQKSRKNQQPVKQATDQQAMDASWKQQIRQKNGARQMQAAHDDVMAQLADEDLGRLNATRQAPPAAPQQQPVVSQPAVVSQQVAPQQPTQPKFVDEGDDIFKGMTSYRDSSANYTKPTPTATPVQDKMIEQAKVAAGQTPPPIPQQQTPPPIPQQQPVVSQPAVSQQPVVSQPVAVSQPAAVSQTPVQDKMIEQAKVATGQTPPPLPQSQTPPPIPQQQTPPPIPQQQPAAVSQTPVQDKLIEQAKVATGQTPPPWNPQQNSGQQSGNSQQQTPPPWNPQQNSGQQSGNSQQQTPPPWNPQQNSGQQQQVSNQPQPTTTTDSEGKVIPWNWKWYDTAMLGAMGLGAYQLYDRFAGNDGSDKRGQAYQYQR